ncbi:FAD-binding oxidoreductase [Nocardia aurea]|uniref:nitric oxide dioxygenase n=1 Tax=Nocardia aurea TaxID=2144174 RepID=A0ABV3G0G5_9NOCA
MTIAIPRETEPTADDLDVVRATLPLVAAHIDEITAVFYRTLFDNHPELIRELFNRGNQAEGTQPRALAASIAQFATHLVDPRAPRPSGMLGRIAHKHASLGITADQYVVVHDNLFAAIVAVLGAEVVTERVAAAWDAVYWSMAHTLIALERDLYTRSGVEPGAVFREVTVVARADDVPGVVVFAVETTDGSALPEFLPGQYISVAVRLPDGTRQLRQYSLVGAPGDGRFAFAVKRVAASADRPAGEVSSWLHDRVEVGDTLEISLPFGDLTVDPDATTPLVLVSAGIGITPMIGILEHLAARTPRRRVLVVHADRDPRTHPLGARLRELCALIPDATLDLRYRDDHGAAPLDLSALDLPADADIYLCGAPEFLATLREQLRAVAIPEHRVHTEQFTPTDLRASACPASVG